VGRRVRSSTVEQVPEGEEATRVLKSLQDVARLVDDARSRGAVKALGAKVDASPELRAWVEALVASRGEEADPSWPGKKLVRAARNRESASRVRSNPIRRDQSFVCLHCGLDVSAGGGHVRDHCPHCLRSRHVDVVPGDRASDCGGLYDPTGFERAHGEVVILYRCRTCGQTWRGRSHADDRIPPDFDVSALPGPAADPGGQLSAVQKRARTLPLRVLETIRLHGLWRPGERVAVAVSGGLDSTVLLELLAELQAGHQGELVVVSIDHGLRPESAGEVARVGRRARALGLDFRPVALGLEAGPGLAARAREARWRALEAVGCDVVATAHHLDDQAETVLQHLLRGSGARGLRGMQPRDGQRVRPLLFEPREVLARWAEDRGLSWDEDPSNPKSERGRIRAAMPVLDDLRAGAAAGLARSARLIARDDAFLDELTEAAWRKAAQSSGLSVDAWRGEPPAIQLRLLLRLVHEVPHGVAVRADQLERLLGHDLPGGASFELPGGWAIEVRSGCLVLRPPPEPVPSG
jgi:tRNA(Ile)-lysidine synthetase-like protein